MALETPLKAMNRLLILSDLWGARQSDWLHFYTQHLTQFDVQYYDSCALAGIDRSLCEEQVIHQQLVEGGIDRAVQKLLKLETEATAILAFSVGGTIAWKAIAEGLKVPLLYAVSATRLRYETEKITCPTKLFYGEKDTFRPNKAWLEKMQFQHLIFAKSEHDCYRQELIANQIAADFIANFNRL